MAQSLARLYVHIIFSTKNRISYFEDENLRNEMHAYLASLLKPFDSPARKVGGTADHVHILCDLSRTIPLSRVIGEIKRSSSKWIKSKGAKLASFHWQNGYDAFSVSFSNVEQVVQYVANQQQHHQKMTFQDELRALLRKHSIEIDERYLWD